MIKFQDIPLKSRYIPVGRPESKWLDKISGFYYPYVLINLLTFPADRKEANLPDDVFLMTDSGGFQVISGKGEGLDWKSSLELQLKIGASKIFAFDKPPFIKKTEGNNSMFAKMNITETKRIIEENVEV